MRSTRKLLQTLALLAALPVASQGDGLHAAPVTGSATHADGWVVVRMAAPIPPSPPASRASARTGLVELDRVILERGVRRIDRAIDRPTTDPRTTERLAKFGLDRTYRFHLEPGDDPIAAVEHLRGLPGVEYAELDLVGGGGGFFSPNDVEYGDQYAYFQFSDQDVDGPEAWFQTQGSDRVVLAILDSGVDLDHPDLIDKIVSSGWDFANDDAVAQDDHGHGSHVASVAAASSNNTTGITGACWNCRILPVKVLNQNNVGFVTWWADGIVWAVDNGADVINLSAGANGPATILQDALQYALDAGVLVVSISHNDDLPSLRWPGRYDEALAVGATDDNDERADPFCFSPVSGSNYGPELDVVAPGELIRGVQLNGQYTYYCGTSQAAPLVTGLVGLLHALNPSITTEETRHLIESGAEDQVGRVTEDTAGFDNYHGWGRVNMERSVKALQGAVSMGLDGGASTRLQHTRPNAVATSHDFIRGSLSSLTETADAVDLGAVTCIENNSVDDNTTGSEDSAIPASGQAFFYLSRFAAPPGPGSYGGSTLHRERVPASGDCP